MINIKSKHNNQVVEVLNDDDHFNIDDEFIYIKDEFDNIIKYDREFFHAEKPLSWGDGIK